MLVAVRNLTKSYGAIHVLGDISFVINSSDRVGIVGSNGVGKSTLLKILIGEEELDSGKTWELSDTRLVKEAMQHV